MIEGTSNSEKPDGAAAGGIRFGDVTGGVNLQAGGDIVAGNKTIIHNIIQQASATRIRKAPYKFLSYYDIQDREIFFGRDAVIDELAGKIPRHKTLILNGQSGVGKTSLINAGLIPRLADNGFLYVCFREYRDPLRQLQEYFAEHQELKIKNARELPLLKILQALRTTQKNPVVVILDQFERFFVGVLPEKRLEFIQQVKACLDSDLTADEMNLVFSLRQDFFGQLVSETEAVIPTFLSDSAHHNLGPLSREEAREAVTKPLTLVSKYGYDLSFVNEVLLPHLMGQADGDAAIEPPHLQIVCNQLYEAARDRHAADIEAGGVVQIGFELYESLGETEGMLRDYLDDCVRRVSDSDEQIPVVRSHLKLMIESGGTRKFVSLGELSRGLPDLPAIESEKIVRSLQNARVVEARESGGETTYSLSHEFMVAKVQSWFDERELQRKKAEETLERALKEFANTGALLDKAQIALVRQWAPDESLTGEDGQRLLALSEVRQTRLRLLKRVAVVAVGLAIVLMPVAIIGWISANWEANRADAKARLALARQLTTQALLISQRPNDAVGYFDRAALLAAQGVQFEETPETRGNLFRVLQSNSDQWAFPLGILTRHEGGGAAAGQRGSANAVAFSPDGSILATGGADAIVQRWNVKSRDPLGKPLRGHEREISRIAFGPNGSLMASASWDGTIRLWDVATGKMVGEALEGHSRRVWCVVFSPDGKRLASCSDDASVRIWEVAKGAPTQLLEGHDGWVRSVKFSPDGRLLVTGGKDGKLRFWDVDTASPLGEALAGHKAEINAVEFSHDGKLVASVGNRDDQGGNATQEIRLWNVAERTQRSIWEHGHDDDVLSVSFTPDDRTLASGDRSGRICLWDVTARNPIFSSQLGDPLRVYEYGRMGPVWDLAFSPDGTMLASASWDGAVRLWGIGSALWESPALYAGSKVNDVSFSPDGEFLVSAGGGAGGGIPQLTIWDVATGDVSGASLMGHKGPISNAVFGLDGAILASGGLWADDPVVRLWDVASRALLAELKGHRKGVRHVAFSPDGTVLASAGNDETIRLWDVKTRTLIGEPLTGHKGQVNSVTFSLDGTVLASAGNDETIRLWDVKTRTLIGEPLTGHKGQVNSVAFSPDGAILASASSDKTIRLWSLETGTLYGEPLRGHEKGVNHLSFSPDGDMLASTGDDRTIRLWDIAAGTSFGAPIQQPSDVGGLAFDPRGRFLAIAAGRVLRLRLDWERCACDIARRNLTVDEWRSYVGNEPYQDTCVDWPSPEK